MNPKTLTLLGGATVVVAALAAWFANRDPHGVEASPAADAPLFGELRERVNDVSGVTITTATESFTLSRGADGWGLADKGGYPVDAGRVKALVLGLSELTLVEQKTANPALFGKLDLQDPGSDPEAPSKRVRLTDPQGSVLADVIVGRASQGGGPGAGTLFVRRAEEGPALEARGRVTIEGRSSSWLDRAIAKLERKRVREVTIAHPDGETLRVYRESPDLQDFQVADLPEGAELSWPGVAGGLAGALEYLNLEDVEPAAEALFDANQAVTATFTTFDGLVVTARTVEQDDKTLLEVAARYDESARSPEPAGPPAAAEGEEGAPAPVPASIGKSPEEVTAEAGEIRSRVEGWVYVVPGYAGANLRKRMAELLKQPEEEADLQLDDTGLLQQGGLLEEDGMVVVPADEGGEPQVPEAPAEPVEPVEPVEPAVGEPQPQTPAGGGGGR